MADRNKRLHTNAPGDFFVDATCINCDTCRQIAPKVFAESHDLSCVRKQPTDEQGVRLATRALLACPTGSIGTVGKNISREVMEDFPLEVADGVFYCGFNSPKSFGGNSYFIRHDDGNWMVDAPKYLPHLVEQFESKGGLSKIFLTHRDDVADAEQYAKHFGAQRIIHEEDSAVVRDAEVKLEGRQPIELAPEFLVIPTPGHTRGHCALLYRNSFLFTGDHLSWDRDTNGLVARPDVCWYEWDKQKQSVALLQNYQFEWILPGHGQSIHLPPTEMQSALKELVDSLM